MCSAKSKDKEKFSLKERKAKEKAAAKRQRQERREEKRAAKDRAKSGDGNEKDEDAEASGRRIDAAELSPRTRARILEEQKEEREAAKLSQHMCAMCERVMPLTAHHLIPKTTHEKYLAMGGKYTKAFLSTCVDICRPCHSAVHKLIEEEVLASDFNTLELLLGDERVQKWINYARKQRPRSLEVGHSHVFKYRR